MSTIFSKILKGEIPCHKLAEDDRYLSFLDVRPINPGHALVIPKKEVDYIFDLDDDLYTGLFQFARPIARAIEKSVTCERIGIIVAGLEVRHTHVHLVPISSVGDINFAKARPAAAKDLAELAVRIRSNLQK